MDKIEKRIRDNRTMKDNTWKAHLANLTKLTNLIGEDYSPGFIKRNDKLIMEYLKELNLHTRKAITQTILMLLTPEGKGKIPNENNEIYSKYLKVLVKDSNKYATERSKQIKNEREESNWVTDKELLAIIKKKEDLVTKAKGVKNIYLALRDVVLTLLYVYNPPRRTDYKSVKLIKQSDFDKLDEDEISQSNYLIRNKSTNSFTFSFGSKCQKSKKMRNKLVNVNKEIVRPLKAMLFLKAILFKGKLKVPEFIFLNNSLKPYKANTFSVHITKLFSSKDKKIGLTLLRHVFISNYFKNDTTAKERKDLAEAMGHTVSMQQDVYRKV